MTRVKGFLYVTIFCILFYAAPNPCCAANAIATLRFTLVVNGTPRSDLSSDIISLSYEDISEKTEITVNNWGAGAYKYSDGNLVTLGTQVALYSIIGTNNQKMSDGRITAVAPKFFTNNEAPVLTFIVSGTKPQNPQRGASQMNVVYPQDLLEFYPVLKSVGVIECTGVMVGNPVLRAGALLRINGVGQRFSGDFSVTETIHRFDMSRGYTTRFTASKTLRPLAPSPIVPSSRP